MHADSSAIRGLKPQGFFRRSAGFCAVLLAVAVLAQSPCPPVLAEDWPTLHRDYARSRKTPETIAVDDSLRVDWVFESPHAPQRAWAGPAKWDSYARIRGLKSMRDYDAVFHPIVVGDQVYFGSSSDEAVHCLDAESGETRWSFITDGPVRIPPTWAEGRLYFGSDDGYAYCVDAENGALVWRRSPKPDERRVINNGRMISFWPVRTGVVVDKGIAYFGASMLPWKESYLCAVNAQTGSADGPSYYERRMEDRSMEGPFSLSPEYLVSPQGRVPPVFFGRGDGEYLGAADGAAGSFVLLTEDDSLYYGPGNRRGFFSGADMTSRTAVATFPGANALVVDGSTAYVLMDDSITAMDRESKDTLWQSRVSFPYEIILAGDTLFAGGIDEVGALDKETGELVWRHAVEGRVHGLVVANGALYASTDTGNIVRFRPGGTGEPGRLGDAAPDAGAAGTLGEGWRPAPGQDPEGYRPAGTDGATEVPLHRWLFDRAHVFSGQGQKPHWPLTGASVRDIGQGDLHGVVAGEAIVDRVGDVHAMRLDGGANTAVFLDDSSPETLPRAAMTIEAWVRADAPEHQAGIAGVFETVEQNPAEADENTKAATPEVAWCLGVERAEEEEKPVGSVGGDGKPDEKPLLRFIFTVTAGAGGPLTVQSGEGLEPSVWRHVAGSFDGRVVRLYVDGEMVSQADSDHGQIAYPSIVRGLIGRLYDNAKNPALRGALHEVILHDRALSPAEIAAHHGAKAPLFYESAILDAGPDFQFEGARGARLRWRTTQPSPTVLEYDLDGRAWRYEDAELKTEHEVLLQGLMQDREYQYAVATATDEGLRFTEDFLCDTFFNYNPAAVPDNVPDPYRNRANSRLYQKAARLILEETGVREGLCLMIGVIEGQLAYELVRNSDLRIIAFDTDRLRVERAREALSLGQVYGARVSVLPVQSFSDLPVPGHCANLLVSERMIFEGRPPVGALEAFRLLRPGAGVAYLGQTAEAPVRSEMRDLQAWLDVASLPGEVLSDEGLWVRVRRPELVGTGRWTHQYGTAANAAFEGESLLGADDVDDLLAQWVGRPGPRYQDDRNGRDAAPLAVNGRLFCQGLERVVAMEAYNGSIVWSLEVPHFMRFNVPRDCSNWCADDTDLFLAVNDKCWRVGQEDGAVRERYAVLEGSREGWRWDWGYIAREGDRLLASAVKEGTGYRNFWGGEGWYDAAGGPAAAKVCSDNFFALDTDDGELAWSYGRGLIINSTITVSDGVVYFLECRNEGLRQAEDRRVHAPELWEDLWLVALDTGKGGLLYERPVRIKPGDVVAFMALGCGRLVINASYSGDREFHLYTHDAATGDLLWTRDATWQTDNHGWHMSRPAIISDRLYVRPHVLELHTGRLIDAPMPGGGCGTYSGAARSLFYRSGNVTMWDLENASPTSWNRLRPDCWISTVPALGMVLSPEGGGGCSCGNWMETSVAFMPDAGQERLTLALINRGLLDRKGAAKPVDALIATAVQDVDPRVRVAAVHALSTTKDAVRAVPALLHYGVAGTEEEQDAARGSLRLMPGDEVSEALVAVLEKGARGLDDRAHGAPALLEDLEARPDAVRALAVETLGRRGFSPAAPAVIGLVDDSETSTRLAAREALTKISTPQHYGLLVQRTREAHEDSDVRDVLADAIVRVGRRIEDPAARTAPLVEAFDAAKDDAEFRRTALGLLGRLGGAPALEKMRAVMESGDDALQTAAWEALAEWPEPEDFDALRAIARETETPEHRKAALVAAMRTFQLDADERSPEENLDTLQDVLLDARTPEQAGVVLLAVAETVPTTAGLNVIEPWLERADAREAASLAAARSAQAICGFAPERARAVALNIRGGVSSGEARETAGAVLDRIEQYEDFVTEWRIAGPYFARDMEAKDLFDMVFPPERAPESATWMDCSMDRKLDAPTVVDLAQLIGGENRCAYLRTNVFVPETTEAELQMGSDDGLKVWLRGEVVHANNADRGLTAGEDKVKVVLEKGWNPLMLKITQGGSGWEACCRIRAADGAHIEGMRIAGKEPME